MSNYDFQETAKQLHAADVSTVAACLQAIAELGVHADLFESLSRQLQRDLSGSGDSDRVVVNLHRFLLASRSPQAWLSLFEREPDALKTLTQLFAASQYMADLLINDPEVFDLLRMTQGQPVERHLLEDEIVAEVAAAADIRSVMRILRDYRHRETLRIAYGDFVVGQSVDVVTEQISNLTDSILQAAVVAAERESALRRPAPTHPDGRRASFAIIALGKLGGAELNYSSDIDLIFIHESVSDRAGTRATPGPGKETQVAEYFQRVGQLIIRLLSESTSRGIAYRVDMRLRPYGEQGPLVTSYDQALNYYDSAGRTWERQAFVKARAVAGDIRLAEQLLQQLQPWIYRRYLMRADITGLSALKRRIEHRSRAAGDDDRNVKFGHGGIRDIEFVIQFLQLLHGGDDPSVRCSGTLEAIRRLQQAGCLTAEEQSVLEENYRFLRQIEHYLQIMYARKLHALPADPAEFERVARRIGYRDQMRRDTIEASATELFRLELDQRTRQNRRIVDHLLHEAFDDETDVAPETDLILDPEPAAEIIDSTLAPYGFADNASAYRHLLNLSHESIPFLSTRRCRHFLAAIAPKLLAAIAATPNPDMTLISLANVTDSLGGKAVLWELFSLNPPSMELCVRLCAGSPYLASILTSNPGMIDELMDSLMLDSLPSYDQMANSLAELCRGAVDIAPILHSFKNSMHLRVGVRNILGKDTIARTHTALSDIAEACMEQAIHHEFHRLVHQIGMPVCVDEAGVEEPAELVVLAVGKLGGREPNYHSDLDVIFLYEGRGATKSLVPNRRFESTTNRHFFNQLCQRVIHAVTRVGSTGRLYELDVRLRPLGRSGELAITVDDLRRYFEEGAGRVWERQALCKARPIWGSPRAQAAAMNCVHDVLTQHAWTPQLTEQVLQHRLDLQGGASVENMKRGAGGTMDVEFSVQLLQLIHAQEHPETLVPGTLEALDRLQAAGIVPTELAETLHSDYQFLRMVESSIRLMNMSARHELPTETAELQRLAYLLAPPGACPSPSEALALADRVHSVRRRCRHALQQIFSAALPPESSVNIA